MWKNSLKNVESDTNKILYETLLDFFTAKRYLLSEYASQFFVFYHYLSILVHSNDKEIFCISQSLELYRMLSQLNPLKVGVTFLEIVRRSGDILDAPMSRDAVVSRLYCITLAEPVHSLHPTPCLPLADYKEYYSELLH